MKARHRLLKRRGVIIKFLITSLRNNKRAGISIPALFAIWVWKNRINTGLMRFPLAERMGFEPMCDCSQTDFECCKTMADSPPEQVVSGRFVRSRRPRRCKGFRTFRPVSAGGDLKCPRVQIKLRSCVKSRRSCAFARSQARKQRPRQHR